MRARVERLFDLVYPLHLDLHRAGRRAAGHRAPRGLPHRAREADVVVLDQDARRRGSRGARRRLPPPPRASRGRAAAASSCACRGSSPACPPPRPRSAASGSRRRRAAAGSSGRRAPPGAARAPGPPRAPSSVPAKTRSPSRAQVPETRRRDPALRRRGARHLEARDHEVSSWPGSTPRARASLGHGGQGRDVAVLAVLVQRPPHQSRTSTLRLRSSTQRSARLAQLAPPATSKSHLREAVAVSPRTSVRTRAAASTSSRPRSKQRQGARMAATFRCASVRPTVRPARALGPVHGLQEGHRGARTRAPSPSTAGRPAKSRGAGPRRPVDAAASGLPPKRQDQTSSAT